MTLTFFCMKAIPGDPFTSEKEIPKEILQNLYKHYGLDKPLLTQYGLYIKGFLKGNFGPSYIYEGRGVNDILREGFPISAFLGLQALAFSLFFGILMGTVGALYHNRYQDHIVTFCSIFTISLPAFLLATLLQYTLAIKCSLFPVACWGEYSHTILPSIALGAMPAAFIARLLRSRMIETLKSPYIQLAKAKGLSTFTIIRRHALKNSILPVISYVGPLCASILTGSFVIEKIFGIPGLGQWLINSIYSRDYTVIMGLTVFFSILLLLLVFAVDLIYVLLDPKIKRSREHE